MQQQKGDLLSVSAAKRCAQTITEPPELLEFPPEAYSQQLQHPYLALCSEQQGLSLPNCAQEAELTVVVTGSLALKP